MTLLSRAALVAVLAVSIAAPLAARDHQAGDISISQPWARATAPAAKNGAGYMTLRNSGDRPDRLVSASADDVAAKVEIHSMTLEGGVMRMRPLPDGVEIPARGETALAPGGNHIMFMGLKRQLRQGASVPVTLRFERAGSVRVIFPVEPIGASGQSGHEGGHH